MKIYSVFVNFKKLTLFKLQHLAIQKIQIWKSFGLFENVQFQDVSENK